MSAPNQNISITYNGYTVGGSSGKPILGTHSLEDGYEIVTLDFDFQLMDFATEADFNTAAIAAEDAFRVPRADCTISNGGSTRKSLSHSGATGFDADAKIKKVGEEKTDSSWSAKFHVHIEFGRPANNVSTSGRRTSTVNADFTPARLATVSIEGIYTQIPGGSASARAQYNASIAAYISSVMTLLGISSYEKITEPVTRHNETNKTIQFTVNLRQLPHGIGGLAAHPELIGQEIEVQIVDEAPGDTPTTNRLSTIVITFSTFVDIGSTTDLAAKYEEIRGDIFNEGRNAFPDGALGLIREERSLDFMNNRISARMECSGMVGDTLEKRVSTRDYIVYGEILVPAWVSNESRAKYAFQGEMKIQRTITTTSINRTSAFGAGGGGGGSAGVVGVGFGFAPANGGGGFGFGLPGVGFGQKAPGAFFNGQGPGGGGAANAGAAEGENVPDIPALAKGCSVSHQSSDITSTPIRKGVSGYSFDTLEVQQVEVYEFYIPVAPPEATTRTG